MINHNGPMGRSAGKPGSPETAPDRAGMMKILGRLCRYLSLEAAQVSRLFCGLEQRLK